MPLRRRECVGARHIFFCAGDVVGKCAEREWKMHRFYKYMAREHWYDWLKNCELKVTKPSEFADPFDCTGTCRNEWSEVGLDWSHGTEEFLKKANDRSWADEYLRVLCLTDAAVCDDASDVLFWSHYASGGRGVRVCFEITSDVEVFSPAGEMECMRYCHAKPVFNGKAVRFDAEGKIKTGLADYLHECVWTKGNGWAYEHEARVIFNAKKVHKRTTGDGTVLDCVGFLPSSVKEITFGPMIDREEAKDLAFGLMTKFGDSNLFKIATRDIVRYRYDYCDLFEDQEFKVKIRGLE